MTEPPRLLDSKDLPAELRGGLQELRAGLPSAERLAALQERLGLPDAPGTAPQPDAGSAVTRLTAGKLAGGAAILITGAALLLWPRGDVASPSSSPRPAGAPLVASGSGALAPPPRAVELLPGSPEHRTAEAPPLPVDDPRESERRDQVASRPSPLAAASGESRQRSVSGPAAPVAPLAPARPGASTARPVPPPSGSTEVSSPGLATTEMVLLREARASLPVDPGEALAFAERHRAEYPRGSLAQEREILAITALTKLGRTAEAAALAERFRRNHPGSAYLRQLERLIPPAAADQK